MSKEIKRKPIIGILPSVEPTNKMTKVNYGYTNGIIKHGGIPMIFTFVEDEADIQQMDGRREEGRFRDMNMQSVFRFRCSDQQEGTV